VSCGRKIPSILLLEYNDVNDVDAERCFSDNSFVGTLSLLFPRTQIRRKQQGVPPRGRREGGA